MECLRENREKYTTFSVPIKKNLIMAKQSHTNYSLLIALELCRPYYQSFLIIYLKFIVRNVETKTVNLNVSLKDLKITNFLIIAKSVEKNN